MPPIKPTLLLTRPAPQAQRFAKLCANHLGPNMPALLISPLQTIVPLPLPDDWDADAPGGVIFTSENGVRAFAQGSARRNLRAFCVGTRTADVARSLGFDTWAGRGDGKALLADLQDMHAQLPSGGLLHVHGAHQAGHLAQDLTDSGIKTRSLTLYKQDSVALSDDALTLIAGNAPVVAPLFSPRSAQIFAQAASHARAPLWLVALSPAVDAACPLPAAHRHIAANPNATAMCDALADLLCQSSPTPAPAPLWPPISDA